jgi:hypothetical protein
VVLITEPAVVSVGGEQKTRANIAAQVGAAGSTFRVRVNVAFTDGTSAVGLADVEFDA